MIAMGVYAYGRFNSKTETDAYKLKDHIMGGLPSYMKGMSRGNWDSLSITFRLIEKFLGVNKGSIKYQFGWDKLKKQELLNFNDFLNKSIPDKPGRGYSAIANVFYGSRLSIFSYKLIDNNVNLNPNFFENKYHKVYLLSILAFIIMLGQASFREKLTLPSDNPYVDEFNRFDEVKIIKKILQKYTRYKSLKTTGKHIKIAKDLNFVDISNNLVDSYLDSINKFPNLSIDNENAYISSINRLIKSLKFLKPNL